MLFDFSVFKRFFKRIFPRFSRVVLLGILAVTGLMMLCVPMAKSDTLTPLATVSLSSTNQSATSNTLVLSLYINNAGLQLAFGLSSSDEPLYEMTLNTWESSELNGHPPNIALNDSPLIFVREAFKKAAPQVQDEIKKLGLEGLPVKVYIAAAGADAAEDKPLPVGDVVNLLSAAQSEICYRPDLKRKEFFQCAFLQEVHDTLLRDQEVMHLEQSVSRGDVSIFLEQDAHLINDIAARYAQLSNKTRAIVVHSTTISQPYLIPDPKTIGTLSWIPSSLNKDGGIHQIGRIYQRHLQTHQGTDPLDYVVAHDAMTSNYPTGAQGNIRRLKDRKLGANNFGRIVGETANGMNHDRISYGNDIQSQSLREQLYEQARLEALPYLNQARESFIDLTLLLLSKHSSWFLHQTPRLIILGEEAEIMFSSQKEFTDFAESLPDSVSRSEQAKLLLKNVTIVPQNDFARLQHQSARHKLSAH